MGSLIISPIDWLWLEIERGQLLGQILIRNFLATIVAVVIQEELNLCRSQIEQDHIAWEAWIERISFLVIGNVFWLVNFAIRCLTKVRSCLWFSFLIFRPAWEYVILLDSVASISNLCLQILLILNWIWLSDEVEK